MKTGRSLLLALVIGSVCTLGGQAQAQTAHKNHKVHMRADRVAEARPLTIHKRQPLLITGEPLVTETGYYDGNGFFRSWDDPRVTTLWGFRLGGDNFYGDQAGEPITRGNASLGMIAGYGGARGGYGGPHFDSVGGFHNGPGTGAQEAADYASGSIWRPHYDRPVPQYPSVKDQVAQLNTGLAGTGQISRQKSEAEKQGELYRARYGF